MERRLIIQICFLLLISIQASNSQLVKGYGLKVGLTMANQDFSYTSDSFTLDSKYRAGLNLGLFIDHLNLRFIELSTEINYTQKGMRNDLPVTTHQNPDGSGETRTTYVRLDYINLRILGKLKYDHPVVSPFLIFGPRIEYKINDKMESGYRSLYDEYKDFLYGISTGIGIELSSLISYPIITEFVYNYDFNVPYKTEGLEVKSIDFEMRFGILLK